MGSAATQRSAPALHDVVMRHLQACPSLPRPGHGDTLQRWRALAAYAAEDVCVVKVLEAHHDALAILDELHEHQRGDAAVYAVWAAEDPAARLEFRDDDGGRLAGHKAWCSGADLVDAALVTAWRGGERVLVEVMLEQPGVERLDGDWKAIGMQRVQSGRVAFDHVAARQVGQVGSYLQRPGFWHGGAGIAACWYGAATAIAGVLRRHPRVPRDPHAQAHLGAIDMALGAAAALLRETAAAIDAEPDAPHQSAVIRVRSVVERVCTDVLDRVGRALGPAPLCLDERHARRCADLATFIRQSHAERDWAALGEAVAKQATAWAL